MDNLLGASFDFFNDFISFLKDVLERPKESLIFSMIFLNVLKDCISILKDTFDIHKYSSRISLNAFKGFVDLLNDNNIM